MNKDIHNKIAHCLLRHSLLTMETIIKYTREHSYKNIGLESQNDLMVNETQLKMKQFPFNIVHFITFEHSTQHFLQQAKNCNFIIAKQSGSSSNNQFTSFSGKNPPFFLSFPIYTRTSSTFRFPHQCFNLQPCRFANAHDSTLRFK